ncbi:glutamine amidotransferase-related protein [Campylobacter avium]|uniref:glutamine amidotransferase-related protein n=1 Tax=Campylobacter avium TaxID=522485 RepID=UPI00308117AC
MSTNLVSLLKILKAKVSLVQSSEGVEMALAHKSYPTFGVQFHQEAILSTYGKRLFKNWLSLA